MKPSKKSSTALAPVDNGPTSRSSPRSSRRAPKSVARAKRKSPPASSTSSPVASDADAAPSVLARRLLARAVALFRGHASPREPAFGGVATILEAAMHGFDRAQAPAFKELVQRA